ncbi:unnamed protein product [Ceutorhynchus assimilis]|uniref:Uncharacterized protein n=1 Tax=Ceutorhynchus assimilis TaxID=467358 RepID=A0A9N9MNP0_9CUCU|nr:unnamed protein product [Ceutorhynchus assimilis]
MHNREVQSINFVLEGKELEQEIHYCISYIVHNCPRVQQLFCAWANLTAEQQDVFIYHSNYIFENNMVMFNGVMGGLRFWNDIQDTEGACGYNQIPRECNLEKQQRREILMLIFKMKQVAETIDKKTLLCEQFVKFKVFFKNHRIAFISKHGDM